MTIIALMGNDGSGKTTIAREISKELGNRGYSVLYKPGFDHLVLCWLVSFGKAILGKRALKVQQGFLHPEEKRSLASHVWPYLVWVDSLIKYTWARMHSGVVLLDRCWYDFFISYEQLGYTNSLMRTLFLSLPRPHCCIILDVDPKVMCRRKRETHTATFEYYVTQRSLYLELSRTMKFPVVNTGVSLEESCEQVMHLINRVLK